MLFETYRNWIDSKGVMQEIYDSVKSPIQRRIDEFMRLLMKGLTNTRWNVGAAGLIFLASIACCLYRQTDWELLSRAGSTITVIGLICMERRLLRLGPDLAFHFIRSALDNDEPTITDNLLA